MKKIVILLISVLVLSGCIKTSDIENDKPDQPINNQQEKPHIQEEIVNKNEEEEQKEETKKEDVKQEIINKIYFA